MATNLYGYLSDDLEVVCTSIEQILGVTFRCEQTAYRTFYSAEYRESIQLLLQPNWGTIDSELMEEDYPQIQILLYVSAVLPNSTHIHYLLVETQAQLLEQRDEE